MNAKNNSPATTQNGQKITSLEIAEISGKRHTDLLRSIRNQEIAWEKINERKFALVEYKDEKGEKRPMYELTKMESLYITSKFNDEIRAKLVHRWMELEQNQSLASKQLSQNAGNYPEKTVFTVKMGRWSNQIYVQDDVIFAKLAPISRFIGFYSTPTYYIKRWGKENTLKVEVGKQSAWFINAFAFSELVKQKGDIEFSKIQTIYADVYQIEKSNDDENPFTFGFTDSEMLDIIQQLNRKPVNKSKVTELLLNGKKA